MKSLTLILLALAELASATPLDVTGGGSFAFGPSTNTWDVQLFPSSDGVHSVRLDDYFGTMGNPATGGPIFSDPTGTGTDAILDGVHYAIGFYSFTLSYFGNITGYDSIHNPVVSIAIIAEMGPVFERCDGNLPTPCTGSFAVAAPEPGTLPPTLAVIALAGWVVTRRKITGLKCMLTPPPHACGQALRADHRRINDLQVNCGGPAGTMARTAGAKPPRRLFFWG